MRDNERNHCLESGLAFNVLAVGELSLCSKTMALSNAVIDGYHRLSLVDAWRDAKSRSERYRLVEESAGFDLGIYIKHKKYVRIICVRQK